MKSQFNFIILSLALFLLASQACRKHDSLDYLPHTSRIDIKKVKEYYSSSQALNSRTVNSNFINNNQIPILDLAWDLAYYPSIYNGQTVFVPIKDKELLLNKFLDATMVFFLDSLNNIEQRILMFAMDKSYYELNNLEPSIDNFTGFSFQLNKNLEYGIACKFQNGVFTEYLDTLLFDSITNFDNSQLSSRTNPPKCPKWKRSWWDETFGSGGDFWNFWIDLFNDIGGIFRNSKTGSGDGKNRYGGQDLGGGSGNESGDGSGQGGPYGSGSGGGPNNNGESNFRDIFSEYQLKLFTKAIKKLNDYFDSDEEMAYWLLILGSDCLEKIANLPPISIDGLEELDCLQEYLRFKASGLTVKEYEDYKADKECKNSTENKAKVEKFKSDVSKAIENELRQLALDLPGVPFDADLLKSIMSKVILKKTGKLIPLVGIGLDVVELRAAYAAGDYLSMSLSIGSIMVEFIPCAMIYDVALNAASIGNTIFKAYKSLNELKSFLSSNSTLFKAISETIEELDLIDALDWIKKGTSDIGQFAVSLGGKTVDEFLELLATKLSKSWVQNGTVKILDFN